MIQLEVFRMSGAGNLFSVIDNREFKFNDVDLMTLARLLCNLNKVNDFASEGLLAINSDEEFDFSVKYLNPDGSTGMMCGNGGRCAVDFAVSRKISKKQNGTHSFSMAGNIYEAELTDIGIKLTLPPPKNVILNKKVVIRNLNITGTYVDVASDHYVIDFNQLNGSHADFNEKSINKFAPQIRYSQVFNIAGVNVNIFRKVGDLVYLFTYERGVEKVTGACGTGAISTAIHLFKNENYKLPITIIPPSSIPLMVDFNLDFSGNIKKIYLSGHSEIIRKDLLIIESLFENEY